MAGTIQGTELDRVDIAVICGYFVFILGVGIWSSKRSKRDSMGGYFLASRSMNWVLVGCSLFASNIGSSSFIGLAGSGASSGIAVAGFELNALFVLLLLGWVFLPVYLASGVYTMPEYLRKRYGGQRIRVTLSVLSLFLYIFTKLSADLYSGAIFMKMALGFSLYISVLTLLLVSAVFTVAGGQTAVIWTDFFEIVLTVIGACVLSILSFIKVGGYERLFHEYPISVPNETNVGYSFDNKSCSGIPDNFDSLLRPATDPEYPWTGMTFGLTISSVWAWCNDQVIVQRALSSKNLTHARGACILTGYLKILPLFLMVLPGMAARVLFPDEIGCSKPEVCQQICGSSNGCTNIAFPLLVIRLMPEGLKGLMMSVLMAALMSSMSSIFNSSATIFSIDIWARFRKRASEMELLIIGRSFVLIMVTIAILWIPIIQEAGNSQLVIYIQSVTSYLGPPVCGLFVMAIFTERVNEKGAFWALAIGLLIGIFRFALDFVYQAPACGSGQPDLRPLIISQVNYLHFGCILFSIVIIVGVTVSFMTKPIDKKHLHRLTFWTLSSKEVRIPIITKSDIIRKDSTALGDDNPSFINDTEESIPSIYQTFQSTIPQFKAETDEKIPWWKKLCFLLCGMSHNLRMTAKQEAPVLTPEEDLHNALNILEEKPFWKNFANINGVLLLAVAIFLYAYYR